MRKFAIVEINENGSIMYRYDGKTYGKKVWQELTEEEIIRIHQGLDTIHKQDIIKKLKKVLGK